MAKSVPDKMGFRQGMSAQVIGLPADLAPVFAEVSAAQATPADWLACFVADAAAIREFAAGALSDYRPGGHLWLCYPKKSGAIPTDITRDRGWEPVIDAGFLPVTQVAIDDTWSALRFRRVEEIRSITRKSPSGA